MLLSTSRFNKEQNDIIDILAKNGSSTKEWCECGPFEGLMISFRYDAFSCVDKHHYRCSKCGKIIQIG